MDNATSISSAAQELANNVSLTTDKVDELEQTIREDQETIAMAIDTAKETIAEANNITEQIAIIQVRRGRPEGGGGGRKKEGQWMRTYNFREWGVTMYCMPYNRDLNHEATLYHTPFRPCCST